MKNFVFILPLAFLIFSCSFDDSNSSLKPIDTFITDDSNNVKTRSLVAENTPKVNYIPIVGKDISKYLPTSTTTEVKSCYRLTVKFDICDKKAGRCSGNGIEDSRGYLKIKEYNSKSAGEFSYSGSSPIVENKDNFWSAVFLKFLEYHFVYKNRFSSYGKVELKPENIIWKVTDSDIKIKSYSPVYSKGYRPRDEEYSVREITAKIKGVNEDASFYVSKKYGIIYFGVENKLVSPHDSNMSEESSTSLEYLGNEDVKIFQ